MADSHVRLLQCLTDKTLEEIPDYQGDPRGDDVLNALLVRHKFPDGNEHFGHLHRVEKKHWDSPGTKRGIENQIRESSGHTGFDVEFYATKDTFTEDAHKCFNEHLRNPACSDYKSDKKLLMPETGALRKAAGAGKFRSKTYLCDFCPVKSMVQQAHFDKIGIRD